MFSSAPHIFRKSQTGISNMLSHCISTLPPSGCRRWFLFCCVHISCRLRGNARAIFRTYCHDHYSKAEYYAGALPDGLGIRYDFKGGSKTELGRGSEGGEVENNSPPHIIHFKQDRLFKLLWHDTDRCKPFHIPPPPYVSFVHCGQVVSGAGDAHGPVFPCVSVAG